MIESKIWLQHHIAWSAYRLSFILVLLCIGFRAAQSQTLSGIRIGNAFSSIQRIIGFPPTSSERAGPFVVAKWRLGDGNSLSVTANSANSRIVYIETDWGGATSYTDFPGVFFGKTTLAEIERKLGEDNYGWYGGSKSNGSLVMQNSYRISPNNIIITFSTMISASDLSKLRRRTGARNDILRSLGLVAISLGEPAYLSSIWGEEHLPKPNARKVPLVLLQPDSPTNSVAEKGNHRDAEVQLIERNGVFRVPVQINGRLIIDFIIDSGAADVNLPADVLLTLYRTGTVSDADFLDKQTYILGDGSKVPSPRFVLRTLDVGGHKVHEVAASVGSVDSQPLLGQSFLSKLGSWSLDNTRHVLVMSTKE